MKIFKAREKQLTRLSALLLAPFIPDSADRMMAQLGLDPVTPGAWERDSGWGAASYTEVQPAGPLFPRIEVEAAS